MLKILLKLKDKELKTFETDKPVVTIGRNKNNDIHMNNLGVSKKHAQIIKEKNKYVIEDLRSTNGTFLNSEKVTKAELTGTDIVAIGKYTLLISSADGASATRDIADPTIRVA